MVRNSSFLAGGSWDARSNPREASSLFFFHRVFYPLAFYFLFSLLTLLASRDFCENVFLVIIIIIIIIIIRYENKNFRKCMGLFWKTVITPKILPGHLLAHFLLSLSFEGQLAPPVVSLFIIFLSRYCLPLLHFFEHGDQGDQPDTMQSEKIRWSRINLLFTWIFLQV